MSDALDVDFSFNKPIPGESLTAELGARPWQNTPQFSTVEDALGFYIPRIAQDEFAKDLINVMESGVPLTSLANVIMLSGVMEGRHSVDVGILSIPALIETMRLIGDSAGASYDTGMEENKTAKQEKLAGLVSAKLAMQDDDDVPDTKVEEKELAVNLEEEKPKGLMSRKQTNVRD